jgi:hypothetical protein
MSAFSTQSIYRGAQIWPYPTMMIGPGLLFFDKHLKVFGPSVSYDFFPERESVFKLEIGARYFNDDRPWIRFNDHEEDYRNQRSDSIDSNIKFSYAFGPKKKFEVGAMVSRELYRFKGTYSEFRLQAPLFPLTKISGKVSVADSRYNKYLYGPTSLSGTGYAALGLTIVIPFVPWDGIIINNFEQSWVTQTTNRNADYVRGNGDHFQFSTRWMWNAF